MAFIEEGSGKDGIAQPSTLAIAYESSEDENEKLTSRLHQLRIYNPQLSYFNT